MMTIENDGRQGALLAALAPGEQLRWSGIPQSSGGAWTFLPGCGGLIFLLIGLVGLWIGWGSLQSDFSHARADAGLWLGIGGVFTLLAIAALVTPFVWRARVRRSIWGVTDRRVLRVIDGKAMTIEPGQLERVALDEGKQGLGTLKLVGHVVRSRVGRQTSRPIWHISDVPDAASAHASIAGLIAPA